MQLHSTCNNYADLPWNYLPLIIEPEEQTDETGKVHGRMVSRLFDFSNPNVQPHNLAMNYPFMNLPPKTLNDPMATNNECREFFRDDDNPAFIGSRIISQEKSNFLLRVEPRASLSQPGFVLIDCGIAHWNDKFWPNSTFRFSDIYHLTTSTIGQLKPTKLPTSVLTKCRDKAAQHGPAAPVPYLAQNYPDSFWALPPDPDDFWHGTAIAALVAEAQGTDLIGFELPKSLLLDWGGDRMTLMMWMMLYQAISQLSLPEPKGRILLPYGFTGGPHDGHHPAARSISVMLSKYCDVELIVPAGNHRQDRLHAKLTADRPKVIWATVPDDASHNTLELCVAKAPAKFTLRIGSGGPEITLTLEHGDYCELMLDKRLIGRVHARKAGPGLAVRVAAEPGMPSHPYWEIEIARKQPASLWILRDDPELALNHRNAEQSRFIDSDYIEQGPDGHPAMSDGESVIKRAGTASVLTTARVVPPAQGVTAVAAEVKRHGKDIVAPYCGCPGTGSDFAKRQSLGLETGQGLQVIGNGSPRLFWAEGTSIAAADYLRRPRP